MARLTDNLDEARRKFGATFTMNATAIAAALGWTDAPSRIEEFPTAGTSFPQSLTRASLAGQPAAIFAYSPGEITTAGKDLVALLAYHSTIEWGLVADSRSVTIFNSHWTRAHEWYSLPPIPWAMSRANGRLLDSFTPQGLTDGKIDEVASTLLKPDNQLIPVDDALVDRLDHWRDEILRYATSLENVDELLHILFAQLFVLRSLEDRNRAGRIEPLFSVIEDGRVNLTRLKAIFEAARRSIQSELFERNITLGDIPDFVLSGIILDLYYPSQLPGSECRYNFAWIEADILGRAYEKYLSTILIPKGLTSPQLRLWEQPQRDVERISTARKRSGVYYTPSFLVSDLTDQCLERYFADSQNRDENGEEKFPRIADISCGSGSFLAYAADALIRHLRQKDGEVNWGRRLVEQKSIIGIDIDNRATTFAKLQLWIRLTEEPDPLPLPSLNSIVVTGDSLNEHTWETLPREIDIILGNPPFIPAAEIQSRKDLETHFETAKGKFDYSYLFIEMALRKLSEGGFLGLVIPNRLFRNRDANLIRDKLTKETDLLTVTDFGAKEIFKGILAYIGSFVARKHAETENSVEKVKFTRVEQMPPRFIGSYLRKAREVIAEFRNEYVHSFTVAVPKGPNRWTFLSPQGRKARLRLSEESDELPMFAEIFQGIRTGANDIFIVQIDSDSGGPLANISNGFGDTDIVERDLLRPMVMGSELQRYSAVNSSRFLVYPYDNNGVLIREADLLEKYPLTHRYLKRYHEFLVERETVKVGGKFWYELQRPRDIEWLVRPKLLSRDLAARISFAVDLTGSAFLVGGIAIVPKDDAYLLPLMGYLNSRVANWFVNHSTPNFQADFQKYETQHFLNLPVPRRLFQDGEVAGILEDLVRRTITAFQKENHRELEETEVKINELIADITNIDLSDLN